MGARRGLGFGRGELVLVDLFDFLELAFVDLVEGVLDGGLDVVGLDPFGPNLVDWLVSLILPVMTFRFSLKMYVLLIS